MVNSTSNIIKYLCIERYTSLKQSELIWDRVGTPENWRDCLKLLSVCACVYVYVCMCLRACVCVCVRVCVRVYVYARARVCIIKAAKCSIKAGITGARCGAEFASREKAEGRMDLMA